VGAGNPKAAKLGLFYFSALVPQLGYPQATDLEPSSKTSILLQTAAFIFLD